MFASEFNDSRSRCRILGGLLAHTVAVPFRVPLLLKTRSGPVCFLKKFIRIENSAIVSARVSLLHALLKSLPPTSRRGIKQEIEKKKRNSCMRGWPWVGCIPQCNAHLQARLLIFKMAELPELGKHCQVGDCNQLGKAREPWLIVGDEKSDIW